MAPPLSLRRELNKLNQQASHAAGEAARLAAMANDGAQGVAQELIKQQALLDEYRRDLQDRIATVMAEQSAAVDAAKAKARGELSAVQMDLQVGSKFCFISAEVTATSHHKQFSDGGSWEAFGMNGEGHRAEIAGVPPGMDAPGGQQAPKSSSWGVFAASHSRRSQQIQRL